MEGGGTVSANSQDLAAKAHEYEQTVLEYEKLDRQIDGLIAAHEGHSRNLSDEDYVHYRELVDLRDLAYNKMKTLEYALLDE